MQNAFFFVCLQHYYSESSLKIYHNIVLFSVEKEDISKVCSWY